MASPRIPRNPGDDYTRSMAAQRRQVLSEHSGAVLAYVGRYSIDPGVLRGNIEGFIGAAQVPIGVAGPLLINGEYASGEFLVPLATTEGSLVASYNRGMRLLSECGGVTTTIVEESMQRGPAFRFDSSREARDFGRWVLDNLAAIRAAAESTTRVGRLLDIGQYQVGPLRYLRFNYTTGDAAGQNLTGKATRAACEWIRDHCPGHPRYVLSGNVDTDKKHSQINTLLTRGRRVVAEAVLSAEALHRIMRVDPVELFRWRQVAMTGAVLAGASGTGVHAANALAALFIATGQDAANVAESHAALSYTQLLDSGDYYWSVTLPALIVATYGGGTGLPTQRECLELLGCYGPGRVRAFAEICAAVVLAGETSLAAAVLHDDWVAAHERLGRNRP
ncbi:hydroxymethylglutaryl-CoA reductase (NADPH) [Actinoplanes octamycinicus]|uniref:hydroxymethylglutaryl-CoA reductase (NADPH) n=1 Tax=Actinoplanes octamycinicus TaxID=135948 RepID=A0A7W7MAC1_9ACTN|nr:hydroxymethylglutaryl-CoA reductase [Actinoplanes octamycinicus]MBB4742832.1 hydroxymethylglutaryl-CoA reductase (NADPH) [Actinoplanes octamycinicus]